MKLTEKIENYLNEDLMIFGKTAYPKSDNVLIMMGGGGSGKGFVQNYLIGLEGKIFNVDDFKDLVLKLEHYGFSTPEEVKGLNLKNPEHTSQLHSYIDDKGYEKKNKEMFSKSIMGNKSKNLPNLIFDTALTRKEKIKEISEYVQKMGYKKENIHLVWVLNDFEIALKQNHERKRTVHDYILLDAHKKVFNVYNSVITDSEYLRHYMDGDFYIDFNVDKIDTELIKPESGKSQVSKSKNSGYLVKSFYIKIKKQGHGIELDKITDDISKKISSYVPN
jgi:hypothetical protein